MYPIDGRITDDGSSPFRAEAGRYHLYYSYYCPWAQRPMIALKLRGLDGVITSSAVDPVRDGRGWAFREGRGHEPDPVNGFTAAPDAYLATDPTFAGHISVPALWDRETEPAGQQPLRDHDRRPRDPVRRLRRSGRRPAPRRHNATRSTRPTPRSCATLATGAYAAMAVRRPRQAVRRGERPRVRRARPVRGAPRRAAVPRRRRRSPTPTCCSTCNLVRFDLVAVPLGRLTRRRLVDHPNLWAYVRDLYGRAAFRETTDFDHIAAGYVRHRRRDPHQSHRARRLAGRSIGTPRTGATRSPERASASQEPGEAELVTVGVAEVEVPLAPRRVGRRHLRLEAAGRRRVRTTRRRRRPRRSLDPRSPGSARAPGRAARSGSRRRRGRS